jgi:hypothetical protein
MEDTIMGWTDGGSSTQNSTTTNPVTPKDRLDTMSALWSPTYQQQGWMGQGQPTTAQGMNLQSITPQASDFKTLANGDYARLEQQIAASRMAPVNAAWDIRKGEINNEMAKRGIFNSGAGIQAQNKEYRTSVMPAAIQAGADAATQRYGQQATDLNNQWSAQWRRPEFLAAMFNGTNAQVSQSGGGGSDGGYGLKI